MILKINPADVVSVPNDYNGAKGRCSKYEVIAEVAGDPADAFSSIVDKQYSKPVAPNASPAAKVALVPQAGWPFPVDKPVQGVTVAKTWPPTVAVATPKSVGGSIGQYDVVRKTTGDTIASGISLHEARTMVAKAVAQKKAVLQVVDSNGTVIK